MEVCSRPSYALDKIVLPALLGLLQGHQPLWKYVDRLDYGYLPWDVAGSGSHWSNNLILSILSLAKLSCHVVYTCSKTDNKESLWRAWSEMKWVEMRTSQSNDVKQAFQWGVHIFPAPFSLLTKTTTNNYGSWLAEPAICCSWIEAKSQHLQVIYRHYDPNIIWERLLAHLA